MAILEFDLEEYHPGLEDGFDVWRSVMPVDMLVPERLEHIGCDWVQPAEDEAGAPAPGGHWICKIPYIESVRGMMHIRRGDYIATVRGTGERFVFPAHVCAQTFIEV